LSQTGGVGQDGRAQRVFAMGGTGLSRKPIDRALNDYVLAIPGKPRPKICLLATASGDPEEQIVRFRRALGDHDCAPSHISLFRLGKNPIRLRDHLLEQDIIYVGGGSMLNLLAIWRAHGVDEILAEAWTSGVVLVGLSAGSMCWFEAGITKSGGPPKAASGLGLLPGSNCVHYDSEPDRRPIYLDCVRAGMAGGYAVDDHVGLLFQGTGLVEAVSSREGARAFRVERVGETVVEAPIQPRSLEVSEPAADAEALALLEFRERHMRRRAHRAGWPRRA